MGAAFSALSFDVENIQSLGWLVPCLCAITVNNIKRTTIIWQAPSGVLKPKWANSSVKEEAKRHMLGAKRLWKCMSSAGKRKIKRRKKLMCVFVETGWGAGQWGGVEDLVGRRARKKGGCKKEQRTFVSFLADAGAGGMQNVYTVHISIY